MTSPGVDETRDAIASATHLQAGRSKTNSPRSCCPYTFLHWARRIPLVRSDHLDSAPVFDSTLLQLAQHTSAASLAPNNMTGEAPKQHPMFDVLYDVRDKIDRVKALEAEKQRTAASFDAAQQNLKDIKSRGQSPTDDDIDRVHQAMMNRVRRALGPCASICRFTQAQQSQRQSALTDTPLVQTQTRLEQMAIMQEIGASSETIFQLREDYQAYCNHVRTGMKPGEKAPPMASEVLKEIAEVMDVLKTEA